MALQDALNLFSRLGIDAKALTRQEFSSEYHRLARRYHPDLSRSAEAGHLMANINAARSVVAKSYQFGY